MSNTIERGVFLIEPNGPTTLLSRGWRGRELSIEDASASPREVALAAARSYALPLEFHSIVHAPERTWIVLRAATSYGRDGASND